MKEKRAILDFIKFAVAEKIVFYRNVITKLTGNTNFPTPDKPLTEAKAAVDLLEKDILATKDGSHTATATKRAAERAADKIFRILAAYVSRVSDGDEAKILGSGFHTNKATVSKIKPELAAVNGEISGNVVLRCKAMPGAKAYIWQYCKDAVPTVNSAWVIAGYGTNCTFEVLNLLVGGKYAFRVAGITNKGATDFTMPVTKIVN